MSYRVDTEKIGDDAENNTAVASAGSTRKLYMHIHLQLILNVQTYFFGFFCFVSFLFWY